MIDKEMTYIGRIIGMCGSCLKPITEGPGGNTVNYSCGCKPRNPLMYVRDDAASSEGEKK